MAKLVLGGIRYESHITFEVGDHENTVKICIRDPNMPSITMAELHLDLHDCNQVRRWFTENFPKRSNGGDDNSGSNDG